MEWSERNYSEACTNVNLGLIHFDHFLVPNLAIYRMNIRQNKVHRSAKRHPERNKGSYFIKLQQFELESSD